MRDATDMPERAGVETWQAGEPGGHEAKQHGCRCAMIDNHHGRGRYGDGKRYGWYVSGNCPVHAGVLRELGEEGRHD